MVINSNHHVIIISPSSTYGDKGLVHYYGINLLFSVVVCVLRQAAWLASRPNRGDFRNF